MEITTPAVISVITVAASILGGAVSFTKLKKSSNEERKKEIELAITQAKEYTKIQVDMLKKDILHMKEVYDSEFANLTRKIDDLRDELRHSNDKVIDLLKKALEDKA